MDTFKQDNDFNKLTNFTGFVKMRAEVIQCLKTIKKSEFIQKNYKELTDLTFTLCLESQIKSIRLKVQVALVMRVGWPKPYTP